MSDKKPKTIDASCPVSFMGCEGEVIVEMTPTEAVLMIEKAWQENKRLRQENASLTAERDDARRAVCCSALPSDYNEWNPEDVDATLRLISAQQGWDCYEDKP